MTGDCHVRIREGRRVKVPPATRHLCHLCGLGILVDQAAQPVLAQDLDTCAFGRRIRAFGGAGPGAASGAAYGCCNGRLLAEDELQVPFAGDQHPVHALAAGTGDPALACSSFLSVRNGALGSMSRWRRERAWRAGRKENRPSSSSSTGIAWRALRRTISLR
jgi:hypothetical protein